MQTRLLSEQKSLKDSANNMTERVGDYLHRGHYDSAEAEKLKFGAVYARLIHIQSSLDSLTNVK